MAKRKTTKPADASYDAQTAKPTGLPITASAEALLAAPAEALPTTGPETEGPRRRTPAPPCPNCKDTQCQAQGSKTLFTWFVCPNKCGFRIKVPRPDLARQLQRQQAQEPAVKRP